MAKMIGKGCSLSVGDSATGPWTKIRQCESIGEIRSQANKIDSTDLDSEEAETIPGIQEPQETPMGIQWDPQFTEHILMRQIAISGATKYWKVDVKRVGVLVESMISQGVILNWSVGPFEPRTLAKMPFSVQWSGGKTWLNN